MTDGVQDPSSGPSFHSTTSCRLEAGGKQPRLDRAVQLRPQMTRRAYLEVIHELVKIVRAFGS
ncbi:hypothetical protein BH11MYX1_BH11MYX1_47400 [soil metagenome]